MGKFKEWTNGNIGKKLLDESNGSTLVDKKVVTRAIKNVSGLKMPFLKKSIGNKYGQIDLIELNFLGFTFKNQKIEGKYELIYFNKNDDQTEKRYVFVVWDEITDTFDIQVGGVAHPV